MEPPIPTMQDVAREAGVGKSTVSLALRDDPRLKESTRRRIQEIAEKMGYRANATVANLMAQLRASRTPRYQATLALVNLSDNSLILRQVETFREWVRGCSHRAEQLGYTLDQFWVYDPSLPPDKLARVLDTRGIRGIIFAGLHTMSQLDDQWSPLWTRFASVILGVRTTRPALHFASNDQYSTAMTALYEAMALGYKRPGLVLDPAVDNLLERRFTGGYLVGQFALPEAQRLPVCELQERTPRAFLPWFRKHRPDVILTLHEDLMEWVRLEKVRVPEDVAFIHLDRHSTINQWAGMEQNNELVGSAAMDLVIAQLHRNETGVPPFPKCVQIESRWIAGSSCPPLGRGKK